MYTHQTPSRILIAGPVHFFQLGLSFLPAVANVERERRRSAQLDEERLRADGDVIRRRAGRRHDRRRDHRDELDFLFEFLLQSEETEPAFIAIVIVFRFPIVFRRMDHRSRTNGYPPVLVVVCIDATPFFCHILRHRRCFDTNFFFYRRPKFELKTKRIQQRKRRMSARR